MAQRGIREFDGKRMLARHWSDYFPQLPPYPGQLVLVSPETKLGDLGQAHPWLHEVSLVVKPDQLFGKRGKHGLIQVASTLNEATRWIAERINRDATIGHVTDKLTHFLIEPFVPHEREYYVAINSNRDGDTVHLSSHGGVDIESVWDSVVKLHIGVTDSLTPTDVQALLPSDTPRDQLTTIGNFVSGLFRFYRDLAYTYLEINPFAACDRAVVPLDLVARVDDTAQFEVADKWGELSFPPPFGRRMTPEEQYIRAMDEKSGASLKLTILNPSGRIWTMVAGGGASVIYADTIVDLGYGKELANYGEYSGNPSTDETYEYARTILDLITREKDPSARPKYLLIGGGIANFTDVAKTFTGIVKALRQYKQKLVDTDVRIFVRRAGPNYEQGLRLMQQLGQELGVPIDVHGPELHMTRIVNLALETDAAAANAAQAHQVVING